MDENTIGRYSLDIKKKDVVKKIEPGFKVEPVNSTENKDVGRSTENPNETPKNIHPFLGHNIDIKA